MDINPPLEIYLAGISISPSSQIIAYTPEAKFQGVPK
jgi:hypothetical protein